MLYIFFYFLISLIPLSIYKYYKNFKKYKNDFYNKYQEYKDYVYMGYINYKFSKNSNHPDFLTKDDSIPFELNNNNDNNKIKILKIETKNKNININIDTDVKEIEDILYRIFNTNDINPINVNSPKKDKNDKDNETDKTDEKIYVTYNYGNDVYRMCVKHLDFKPSYSLESLSRSQSQSVSVSVSEENKQIIWAYLKKNDGTILEVTDTIKMFQGPSCDFHTKIKGISNKLVDIFSHSMHSTHEKNDKDLEYVENKINLEEWNHLHIENFYEEIVIDIDIDTLHEIEINK